MKAVYGIVWIRPDKVEEVTPGGIVIPDRQHSKDQAAQMAGTIVGCGGNCFDTWAGTVPTIGNRVVYNRYAGFTIQVNGEACRAISDDDIHFIMEEGDVIDV